MKPSELLREALESFGPEGENWWQGGLRSPDGEKFCSFGAGCRVLQRLPHAIPASTRWAVYLDRAAALLSGDAAVGHVTLNDDPSTTFEDVRLMFKHAIALAEADEQ